MKPWAAMSEDERTALVNRHRQIHTAAQIAEMASTTEMSVKSHAGKRRISLATFKGRRHVARDTALPPEPDTRDWATANWNRARKAAAAQLVAIAEADALVTGDAAA